MRHVGTSHFLKTVSSQKLQAIRPRLEPGDLLLQRQEGKLSNLFIPSYFTHVAFYLGPIHKGSFANHPLIQKFSSDFKQEKLVLEATPPHITLSQLKDVKASFLVVVRPKWPSRRIRNQTLLTLLASHGKPYDFWYNEKDCRLLTCAEQAVLVLPWIESQPRGKSFFQKVFSPDQLVSGPRDKLIPVLALHHDEPQKSVEFHLMRIQDRLGVPPLNSKSIKTLSELEIYLRLHRLFRLWISTHPSTLRTELQNSALPADDFHESDRQ